MSISSFSQSVIVHQFNAPALDRGSDGTAKMADVPSLSNSPAPVAGFISSQTLGSLGWGSSLKWLVFWRVWPRHPLVSGCLRCRSRRSERPEAPTRPRHRCRGDCWLCCRPGCRLGWSNRWRWSHLVLDLTKRTDNMITC